MSQKIRQIRIEGNLAYVPLTQGYEAIIDAADVPLVEGFNWCASVAGNRVYAVRGVVLDGKAATIWMHRVIMSPPDHVLVDHRDGDGMNNRRKNLRIATKTQNNRNTRKGKNNTSGFKGVSWDGWHGKWRAFITVDRKRHTLGCHSTAEEAHAAYCEASARLHGEFGRTE